MSNQTQEVIQERVTALKLAIKPGESITIEGPTRIKLVRSGSGRAELVFIGPESTKINRTNRQVKQQLMEDASTRDELSAASVCS